MTTKEKRQALDAIKSKEGYSRNYTNLLSQYEKEDLQRAKKNQGKWIKSIHGQLMIADRWNIYYIHVNELGLYCALCDDDCFEQFDCQYQAKQAIEETIQTWKNRYDTELRTNRYFLAHLDPK